MKRLILSTIVIALAQGACSKSQEQGTPPAPAAAPVAPAPAVPAAVPQEVATLPAAAAAVEAYVDQVEAEFRSRYSKKEIDITPEMLLGVTSQPWQKMHAYADNGTVKRIKLYPKDGAAQVEEFYYRDGVLVYVSDEPQGGDSGRQQFFFSEGQLVAALGADGRASMLSDADRERGQRMLREAEALLAIASRS